MLPKDRIIVALDVNDLDKAKSLVEMLTDYVGGFKIGLELICLMLASIISPSRGDDGDTEARRNFRKIRDLFEVLDIKKVFWDGKFDDIPNTVGAAVKVIAGMGVKMFNVHASAGIDAMMAAVANKGQSLALGVTVLTSREENEGKKAFQGPEGF